MNRTKNIIIIPARGKSKRLPGKNIMLLKEQPLIAHSINYAKKHKFVDEIYVSTNSEAIKEVAKQYGAKIIDRPESLSGDLEPTVTALKHVLEHVDFKVDNVILLQPTNPLRPEKLLEEAYNLYIEQNLESLFTVSQNSYKLGKIKHNKFEPFNYKIGQRSQDLEPLYYENGLLYITKAELIKQEIIISENGYPYNVTHPYSSVDIDTLDDFNYAKYIIQQYSK